VNVPRDMSYSLPVQKDHTAFGYVFVGKGTFGKTGADPGQEAAAQHLVVFSSGDEVTVTTGPEPVGFLLLAGKPLHEPIARYGPFVMNTRGEVSKAFEDYRRGSFLQ